MPFSHALYYSVWVIQFDGRYPSTFFFFRQTVKLINKKLTYFSRLTCGAMVACDRHPLVFDANWCYWWPEDVTWPDPEAVKLFSYRCDEGIDSWNWQRGVQDGSKVSKLLIKLSFLDCVKFQFYLQHFPNDEYDFLNSESKKQLLYSTSCFILSRLAALVSILKMINPTLRLYLYYLCIRVIQLVYNWTAIIQWRTSISTQIG